MSSEISTGVALNSGLTPPQNSVQLFVQYIHHIHCVPFIIRFFVEFDRTDIPDSTSILHATNYTWNHSVQTLRTDDEEKLTIIFQ